MRRRGMWMIMGVALLSLLLVSGLPARPVFSSRPLVDSMNATGAIVKEVNINGWSKVPLRAGTEEDLEQMVHEAMTKMGIDRQQYQISRYSDKTQRMVRGECFNDSLQVVVAAQTIGLPAVPDVYIVVNILTTKNWRNLTEWQNKASQIIKDMGGLPRISTCLVGWLDGKLEEDEWMKRLHTALNALDATVVSAMYDPDLTSIAGYSPVLPGWLTVEDRRINVNLAMRYSPYDNRTYITIGSPVITREY